MVTDPRPAKLQSLALADTDAAVAAGQNHAHGGAVDAAVMADGAPGAKQGANKALRQPKGIGRHRLPEADPKLEESKVPAKARCGGCSIM
jgi:hypothetical protein